MSSGGLPWASLSLAGGGGLRGGGVASAAVGGGAPAAVPAARGGSPTLAAGGMLHQLAQMKPRPLPAGGPRRPRRCEGFVFWTRAYRRRWRDKWLMRTEGCRCRAEARACRPPMAWLSRVKGREAPFPGNSAG